MSEQQQANTNSNQATEKGRLQLSDSEFVKYIAETAAQICDEKTKKREAVYRSIFGIVIGFLAIFGYTNLANLKSDTKSLVFAEIKPTISDEVKQFFENNRERLTGERFKLLEAKIEEQIQLSEFVRLAAELNNREESFTKGERDAAVEFLKRLSKSKEIRSSQQFKLASSYVLRAFAQAGLDENIDIITNAIDDVISSDPEACEILVQHYGMRVIGAVSISPELNAKFDKLAKQARIHGLQSLTFPFEIMREYKKAPGPVNSQVELVWQEVRHLEPKEKAVFIVGIRRTLNEAPKSGMQERMKQIITAFNKDYRERIDQLSQEVAFELSRMKTAKSPK